MLCQTHVQRYLQPLLDKIESEAIDSAFVVTDRIALAGLRQTEEGEQAHQGVRQRPDLRRKDERAREEVEQGRPGVESQRVEELAEARPRDPNRRWLL